MKIITLFAFLVCCVHAQSVIHAIPTPPNASGLAWDGTNLWCGAYGVNGDTIYKIDPANGAILKKLVWGYQADSYGMTFDAGDLWVNDHLTGQDSIFRIDTITGARVHAIPAHKEFMAGLANDGSQLWHCLYYNPDGRAYYIDKTNGNALDSIDIYSLPQPWGAAWDGVCLWVCNDGNYGGTHSMNQIDVGTQQIIDQFTISGVVRPWGATWDGTYLWMLGRRTSPSGFFAYQIDLTGGGTPEIAVTPMSYDFGIVPCDSSESFELTIANLGDTVLVIDSIFTTEPVFSTLAMSYPFDIPAQDDTTVTVYFEPDTDLVFTGQVLIASTDPDEETTFVSLQGTGVFTGAMCVLSDTIHDYGSIRLNAVADWYLTASNQGYSDLTIDSITFNSPHFFCTADLPVVLSVFDTLRIQVITHAETAGMYSGIMLVYSNDPGSPHSVNLEADGAVVTLDGGDLLWSASFPDNVVCVAGLNDITGDSIPDVVAESYGTDTYGLNHIKTFWGNSWGQGVSVWGAGDESMSGSWGDDCLFQGDDYDSDGIDDVLLGTAWGDRSVYALSTADGSVIWYYDSHWFDGEGGWVYSVRPMPDIDGDGIGEVLAGIGGHDTYEGPRSMYCFSGIDGTILWRFQANDAVASVGWIEDVNGDDVPDAVCGTWGNSIDQHVYCVSGASNGVVYTPLWSYDCGGDVQSVIIIPDMDGDGIQDVVAGAWSDSVYCLSGASGARIWATFVESNVMKVASIPDMCAPGIPGIGVAHWGYTFHVLNAETGAHAWTYPIGYNTWTVAAIGDVDGDSIADVLTGNQTPGTVYCFSGQDGTVIWTYAEGRLIYSVRSLPDISDDGYDDVIVGTQKSSGIAHLLALCGGTPGSGVADTKVSTLESVHIYPRISSNVINLQVRDTPIIKIVIYDITGRLVKEFTPFADAQYDISWRTDDQQGRKVSQGIYFISILGNEFTQVEKVVVVR
ncbi:MAG: choice-of-anchor D domain-containing protein [candidate division WOR-3 bacterium]|nr:MAG: choice-of-anchor D domain-containing protein [candidate division WOR-3 bacterium]